ncbi:unnamed protein product [Parnassius apollo]|uniref:(apollo) hypothetical protein n=1 Tax=Parnassius apollo TaxID=110799 RepID=A0A8S3X637_PARAO|nr:unnamed protein product [Parnassius apollo]
MSYDHMMLKTSHPAKSLVLTNPTTDHCKVILDVMFEPLRRNLALKTKDSINFDSTLNDIKADLPDILTITDPSEAAQSWSRLYPSTEQNLADQVRYVLRSNIFGDAELKRLRREAVLSSNGNGTAGNAAQQTAYVDAAVNIPFVVNSDDDGIFSHELEKMRSILEESMLETRSMLLENRQRLPLIPLSKRNRAVVQALNPMLVTYLEANRDLCEIDSIPFGAALAVCRIIDTKLLMAGRATQQSSAIPAWRKRIKDRIAKARALIGRLTSFRSGNNKTESCAHR